MADVVDHKAFLSAMPEDLRTRLTRKSDLRGLLHLVLFWGLMILLWFYVHARLPFWPLMMLPLGIVLVFNFTLAHECTHKTPFRSNWINEWVGHVSGALVFTPFLWFRAFHMAHHRYTNDPEKDPEIKDAPRPEGWRAYLWHLTGLSVWRGLLMGTFSRALGRMDPSYVAQSARRRIRVEATFHVCFYVLIALYSCVFSSELLVLWLLPLLLGQPFLRLYLLAEHGRCPEVANMFENTRTVLTTGVIRFLAWNMPYHVEHHIFPQVPFHRLGDLHREIEAHIRIREHGYVRFHKHYVEGFGGVESGKK